MRQKPTNALYCFGAWVLVFAFSFPAFAAGDKNIHDGEAIAFYIENDSRSIGGPGSDQAYSNGFKFSYIYAEDRIPAWGKKPARDLDFLDQKVDKAKVNFALSLGQQIYTPNNISLESFIPDDRPYAGWLYLGFAVQVKEEETAHFLELDLGIVGPSALGQEVQNNYHDLVATPRAEGWNHSLHDEPTVQLFYQKRYKYLDSKTFDFVPYYGAGFGNVQIAAHAGGLIRFGSNLPDDFGPGRPSASEGDSFVSPTIHPNSPRQSYYIFGGVRGSAIARSIFLDGNTFQSSHSVKKYPFTFETEFGIGLQIIPFAVVWRFVTRSPEFEERSRFNSFASINMIYIF